MRPTLEASAARRRARGFTLVEIIVAAALSALVITALLSVLLQTLKAYSFENGELNVNLEIRKLTNELTTAALPATYFRVLNSYSGMGYGAFSSAADAGGSGDCAAFVYKNPNDDSKFTKIVVYFRTPDASNEGTVRCLVADFTSGGLSPGRDGPIDNLIPSVLTPLTRYPQVVGRVRGLGANGKLFTNFNNRSLVINGEIIRAPTGQFRRASHTFSFSVTPR